MTTENHRSFSATALSTFSACRRATLLDREVENGAPPPPYFDDPALHLLRERGRQHEARYLARLEEQYGEPAFHAPGVPTTASDWTRGAEQTLAAMKRGHRVIFQAPLVRGVWRGCVDFLERVDHEPGAAASTLGSFHYRAVDTKLAQYPRGSAVLQLCVYTEILSHLQGVMPDDMVLVSPAPPATASEAAEPKAHVLRTADFAAYFRRIRARMEHWAAAASLDDAYPEVCERCDVCDWWPVCNQKRRDDDHLSFVAGMSRRNQKLLQGAGINTLEQLGRLQLPMVGRPRKLRDETLQRLQHQGRLQLEARESTPRYELLSVLEGKGLARLPEPSRGDIFFDIEADRYAIDGTFVYLFGWSELDDAGVARYRALWATTRAQERANFVQFVDHVRKRQQTFKDLRIFHFAHTERTVLSDLAGRYATRESAVDDLLRDGVFCDLLPIVKQALRAGVETYSLKDLEQFHGFVRATDLREAAHARRVFELAREDGASAELTTLMATIEAYNREDCESTLRLRDWLETLRKGLIASGAEIARPMHKPLGEDDTEEQRKKVAEWERRVEHLRAKLLSAIPAELKDRSGGHDARQLLADLLDWHRRSDKPNWREYFRARDLTPEECFDESAPIGLLGPETRIEPPKKARGGRQSAHFEYSFPAQEYKLRPEDRVECPISGEIVGEIVEIRRETNVVVIKRGGELTQAPVALIKKHNPFPPDAMQEALADIVGSLAVDFGLIIAAAEDDWGMADVTYPAARALLLKEPPRLLHNQPLRLAGESAGAAAVRVTPYLDQTVLAIQGPPGSGKSHTGARMILELLKRGKDVGITATSHKVIANLLRKVHVAAREADIEIHSLQKLGDIKDAVEFEGNVATKKSGSDLSKQIAKERALHGKSGFLLAGTQFFWASAMMRSSVDVLLIDEAGQFSLANALAVSVATKSLVLLGDPRQLAQPDQGSHPPGAGASALEHMLAGHDTIPADRGIFLDQTWRLPPSIAKFTSKHFYAGRLAAHPSCAKQRLCTTGRSLRFDGSGIFIEEVQHEGNVSSSAEEAARVVALVRDLLSEATTWSDRDGRSNPLRAEEILIVAPYNAQVQLITEALRAAEFSSVRVGTVDKFQGQEAPVVIYSMTTSSPEDAPRGFEFLFELERLNVATSRAQAVVILVASPRLFEAECKTPQQMRLVNGLCGAAEFAAEER